MPTSSPEKPSATLIQSTENQKVRSYVKSHHPVSVRLQLKKNVAQHISTKTFNHTLYHLKADGRDTQINMNGLALRKTIDKHQENLQQLQGLTG